MWLRPEIAKSPRAGLIEVGFAQDTPSASGKGPRVWWGLQASAWPEASELAWLLQAQTLLTGRLAGGDVGPSTP